MKKFTCSIYLLFTILVSNAQVLVSQNFNTLPIPPAGWNISALGAGGNTWSTSAGTGVVNAQAFVEAVENFNYNEGLYAPILNLTAGDIISINFDYTKTNASPGVLKLVRATSQTNASSTVIQTINLVTNLPTAHSFSYTVPTTGSFYIGLLYTDYFPASGGAASTFLSIDNVVITKTGSAPTACSGTPPAGSSAGPATDNYNENGFSITHTNPSTLTGFTYQWQKQVASSSWVNMGGTGSTSLAMNNVTQSITTNYRMITTCTNGGISTTSTPFTVVSPVPAYATLPITEYFETNWLNVNALRDAPNSFSKTVPSSGQRSARREDDAVSANWLSPSNGVAGITPYQGAHCARFHTTAAFFQPESYLDFHFNGAGGIYKKIIYLENGATEGDALLPEISIDGGLTFANLIVNSNEPTGIGSWNRKTIYFTASASTSPTSIFRLRALNNDLPTNNSDIFLDSLAIFNIPPCSTLPTNVVVSWGENFTTCDNATYTTVADVCGGQSIKLYATNLPAVEAGLSYTWEKFSSTTGGSWVAIPGSANNPSITASINEVSFFRVMLSCSAGSTQASGNIITVNVPASSECFSNNVPFNPVIINQQETPTPSKKYFNNKFVQTPFGNIIVGCNWMNMNKNLWYQFVATAPTVNVNMSEILATQGTPSTINFALYKSIASVYSGITTGCGNINVASASAIQSITGLTVGTTYLLRLGMPDCTAAISGKIWLSVPTVAFTPANACTVVSPITINTANGNNNQWVGIYYNDVTNIVAEINANGNDLNAITAQVYRNTNAIRTSPSGMPYLDRNVQISVATQPTGMPVSVRIYITQAEFDALSIAPGSGVSSLSNLMLTKLSGTCASTISGGGSVLSVATGSNGTNFYLQFDVTSFSTFFVHGPTFALPINLLSFTATPKKNFNAIAWYVSDALNFKHFDLERGNDGINFKSIKTISYENIGKYNFNDYYANTGVSFYRLKMVDEDGTYKYSSVVKCKQLDKNTSVLLQNPVQQLLAIKRNTNSTATIQLYNSAGQKIIQQLSNDYFVNIPISNLVNGLYTCTITTNSGVEHLKFIKN